MTIYFIDYENVNGASLGDFSSLKEDDRVEIFYSDQCRNISLEVVEQLALKEISIAAHGVSTGAKNALDFQLSTYLGYIVAVNRDAEYVIVSKDTGFDRVVEFWQKRKVKISRVDSVASTEPQTAANVKTEAVKKEAALPKQNKKSTPKKQTVTKTKTKAKAEKAESIILTTKEELLKYLSEEEYSERLLNVVNSYKSKTAINNSLTAFYRDSAMVGGVMKKLKPLLKEKGKS